MPDSIIDYGYVNIHCTNTEESQDFASALNFSSKNNSYTNFIQEPELPDYGEEINIRLDFIESIDSVFWEIDTLGVYTYIDEHGIEKINAWYHSERDSIPYTIYDSILNTEIDTFRFEYVTRPDTDLVIIKCNEFANLKFENSEPFIALNPNHYYAHRIVWYKDGERSEGSSMKFYFNELFDIEIISLQQGGIDFPAIEMEVALHGEDSIEATIDVYKNSSYTFIDSNKIFTTTKMLVPDAQQTIYLPVIAGLDTAIGRVNIQGKIKEKITWNNYRNYNFVVNHFLVSPEFGTTIKNEQNDTIWYNNQFFVSIPANSNDEPFVLKIDTELLNNFSQPDFLLNYPNDSIFIKHNLSFSKEVMLSKSGSIGFISKNLRANSNVIEYDPLLNLWKSLQSTVSNNILYTNFITQGTYSSAQIKDTQIPGIEVNFDGKRIDEQSYVDSYPTISFIFNDDNGINLSEDGLKIWIDDEAIEFSQLIKKDTITNFTNVSCSYRSQLESDRHAIKVSIEDAAHNINEQEFEFNIFKNLKILDYGNYPNPFNTRTWFVFETTKNVEEFKIQIYSPSGRKIRTIDDTNIYEDKSMIESGYHEISWDGKDDNGDNIANGVYYYRMVGKTNDKTVTQKGVIAKLK